MHEKQKLILEYSNSVKIYTDYTVVKTYRVSELNSLYTAHINCTNYLFILFLTI
jgi:hypothetical protein